MLYVILVFFHASMFLVVYNLNSRDHTLAKQLRFNQPVSLSLKIPLQVITELWDKPYSLCFLQKRYKA